MKRKRTIIPKKFTDLGNGAIVVNLIDGLFKEIYLVGGAVRDEILGAETKDLDFATPHSADEIERILENAGLHTRSNGKRFGTIATHIGEYDIQITAYRSDDYEPGSRQPTVSGVTDIDSDLSRRDFTINAMAVSRDEFVDPYEGVRDIHRQIIRCVGDAGEKFREDPLRMVRAFRIVAKLGYDIQPETLLEIKANRDNLYILSTERIAEEMKKIISGNYWSDAIYEMAESGVLSSCLKNLELVYGVSPVNVLQITDDYSQRELSEMDVVDRWKLFFTILLDAEKSIGISTTAAVPLVENLGKKLLLGSDLTTRVLASFDDNSKKDLIDKENLLKQLEVEYKQLKAADDPRYMIPGSKLASIKGKDAFRERSYIMAANYYAEAQHLLAENIDYINGSIADADKRNARLDLVKKIYSDRYSKYLASRIMADKLYARYLRSDDLIAMLKRNQSSKKLNARDVVCCIEEAIVKIYQLSPADMNIEPYNEFLESKNRAIGRERIVYLTRRYYYQLLSDKSLTNAQRAVVYEKIAQIAKSQSEDGNLGLDFYDPRVDSLLYSTRATKDLADFWKQYDVLDAETDVYLDVSQRQGRWIPAIKRAHLNAATALIHGLSLAKKLRDKHSISRLIVANYLLAGRKYSKNAHRFRVYLDWFDYLRWLQNSTETSSDAILAAAKRLKRIRSYQYVDPDESFFSTELREISHIRDRFVAIHATLEVLSGRKNKEAPEKGYYEELDATLTLFKLNLLSSKDSYKIIRNHYLKDVDNTIEPIPLGAFDESANNTLDEDLELIQQGESERVELKESWRYSRLARQILPDISQNIVKTLSAFMNTHGGKLFIGVHDDGTVIGLEETDLIVAKGGSLQQKIDDIKLSIDEAFDKAIGSSKSYLKELRVKSIEGKTVLIIDVKQAQEPVFVKLNGDEIFCIRAAASTRTLQLSEAYSYIASAPHLRSA